ncbi:MAG: hypothetical protein R3E39_11185 [Anaerolineae bacterium]
MTQRTQESDASWVTRHVVAVVGILIMIVIVVVAGFQPNTNFPAFWIWLILLGLFMAMTLVLSRAFTRRWLGILIDERNKYSLSRFQMALWTLIILSSFMAAVLANVRLNLLVYVGGAVDPPQLINASPGSLVSDVLIYVGVLQANESNTGWNSVEGVDLSQINLAEPVKDGQRIYVPRTGESLPLDSVVRSQVEISPTTPLSIQIPGEVWVLLGISTTSLVASPLIKGQKSNVIVQNHTASEARFSDLFKGEESGNFNLLDLSKLQMMYFTLIVIGAYMIAVANMFLNTNTAIASLPALDGGVVAMLGVSHAGYLGNKAVKKGGDTFVQADAVADPPPPPPQPPAIPAPPPEQGGVG